MKRSRVHWGLVGLAASALCGCEEKGRSAAVHEEAGAQPDKFATADPKLSRALQAAAGSGADASEDGPPPDGIFAAGVADRRHPPGAPTKVELINDGSEPRLSLQGAGPSSDPLRSTFGPAGLELAMQMGPRTALPTVDLSLLVGPSKGDDAGPGGLSATVKSAVAAREQIGQLPPELAQQIATLNGTQFTLAITGDGRESDVQTKLGKSTQPELERVASNAADALVLMTVPLPTKPVGVGAQWLAETRMPWSGLDVIAYRAYRVSSIAGQRATLAVTVKAYAASKTADLQGLPKGAALVQVDVEAQGETEVVPGEVLARKGAVQERTVLVFQAPPDQVPDPKQPDHPEGNVLTAQMKGEATLIRGEDLRAEAAKVR